MNCREIQDIILTDYIDGRLDQKRKCFIDEHLEHCHQCKEFFFTVQERLVMPFSQAEKQKVPAVIWDRVKEAIEAGQEQPRVSLIDEILERLRQIVAMPKPVFAFASVVTLVLMIGILPQFLMSNPAVKIDAVGQVESLSLLTGTGGEVPASESVDLGTPIEKYFL